MRVSGALSQRAAVSSSLVLSCWTANNALSPLRQIAAWKCMCLLRSCGYLRAPSENRTPTESTGLLPLGLGLRCDVDRVLQRSGRRLPALQHRLASAVILRADLFRHGVGRVEERPVMHNADDLAGRQLVPLAVDAVLERQPVARGGLGHQRLINLDTEEQVRQRLRNRLRFLDHTVPLEVVRLDAGVM